MAYPAAPFCKDADHDWVSDTIDVRISVMTRRTCIATFFAAHDPTLVQCKVPVELVDPPAEILLKLFEMMRQESDDGWGFHHNSHFILDNWKNENGTAQVLAIKKPTEALVLCRHPWFVWAYSVGGILGTDYLYFPVLVSTETPHDCDYLWVSKVIRGRGVGRVMTSLAKITHCGVVIPEATAFWDTLSIPYKRVQGRFS
jgi:hypothetical protein